MSNKPIVTIFTDGSYNSKTNCGGWGASLYYNDEVRHMSGSDYDTTNNQMELMAVIVSLEELTCPCIVDLHSDSKYVLEGIGGWIHGWARKGWKTKTGDPVKNVDLWKRIHAMVKQHRIRTHWVKGHSGVVHNEIVDRLADDARSSLEHTMLLDKRYGGY